MFTGIIEELGRIRQTAAIPQGRVLTISAERVLDGLRPDDSVSVNGVCLTATRVGEDFFEATAVRETLEKSTLGRMKQGTAVNLERALRLNARLGGHWVQGHVDGTGTVVRLKKDGAGRRLEIRVPRALLKYMIDKGSIAVDGISLTLAGIHGDLIGISVIPHTWEKTNLSSLQTGSEVNIEVDVLGKYVEKLVRHEKEGTKDASWYKSLGY